MSQVGKIDSSSVGTRIAVETTPTVLPATPKWVVVEVNSFGDHGGNVTTVARETINDGRQRKKGVITDIEGLSSIETDLTQNSHFELLPGLFYAAYSLKATIENLTADTEISDVATATDTYTVAASGTDFKAGDIVWASGFTNSGNNGVKNVASSTATTIVVSENLTDEASVPKYAKLEVIGFTFGTAEVDIDVSTGPLPRLVRASGTKDFTDFGLVPGEIIFIGGDATANKFATANNNGFVRIRSITATYLEIDKSQATMADETGTGLAIKLYFGRAIKNETGTDIVRRTYQIERSLGYADDSLPAQIQSEYLPGCVLNEMTVQVPSADKIITELSFMSRTPELRDGATGLKGGDRPTLVSGAVFNTSTDVSRVRMAPVSQTSSFPTALFIFVMEMTLSVKNNNTRNLAVGNLGAFDHTAGTFEVGGELTAYFGNISALTYVQTNADVTLDLFLAKDNAGIAIDVPLITLSGGLANVALNEPIKLPLTQEAAEATDVAAAYDHTLLMVDFPYLPTLAE
jgi:hypothetical protein